MNNMACRETQGRTSPLENTCDHVSDSTCGHDCAACLSDFELTQQHAERLRVSLLQEQGENQELWLEARLAMRQTLYDLIPQRRLTGTPGETAEFGLGWERCREEIERRIQELAKVL